MSQGLLAGPAPPPMTCRHISAAGGRGSPATHSMAAAVAPPSSAISSRPLRRDAALAYGRGGAPETPWPGPIGGGPPPAGGGVGSVGADHHHLRPATLIRGDFGTKSIKALQGMLEGLSGACRPSVLQTT
ncbi:hypothetical protein PVAP13_6KG351912 [Panicum virgatum]|uniref:Uncharacterized protein n=1 Tax=Panicum virgatum TaxID=38727 RepID=A0A8T0RJJ9_PANVG|nr:hypothetical protein PVAP13_6KG351912 [Panicum virgatum]